MIYIKNHETLNIFKPFPFLGPKRRTLIEASWAKLFRDHILFGLPVDKIFKNYQWATVSSSLVGCPVQSVMPLNVKGILVNRFLIG